MSDSIFLVIEENLCHMQLKSFCMLPNPFLFSFCFSCGPHINTLTTTDMVSRRRILSRSRDDLNLDVVPGFGNQEEEEDVWYQKEKLYKVRFI